MRIGFICFLQGFYLCLFGALFVICPDSRAYSCSTNDFKLFKFICQNCGTAPPMNHGFQWLHIKLIDPMAAVAGLDDQAGFSKIAQMFRNRWTGNRKSLSDLSRRLSSPSARGRARPGVSDRPGRETYSQTNM